MLLIWCITMGAAMQELMRQLHQEFSVQAFLQAIEQMRVDNSGVKGDLRDRVFREIGVFHGDETRWKEWSVKFSAAAKESNMQVFEALKWSETFADEITAMDESAWRARTQDLNDGVQLGHPSPAPPLTIHQGVADENGLEVWRLLNKRYSPVTPIRDIQFVGGHEPRQDLEGQGHPGVHQQVGGLHEHARTRLLRYHLEPNVRWDIGPHDV